MMNDQQRLIKLRSALTRITKYQPPEKIREDAERIYGLDYTEALEMAYENVLSEVQSALNETG